jgi:WD40 repeat protein
MSNDGSLLACVDIHDDHNIYVFDANSGATKFREKGDTNKIFDICFSDKPGDNTIVTAGSKHIKFWYPDQMKGEKGLFGQKGEMTSFACCAYDANGVAYTGGCNSQIYVWNGRDLASTIQAHKGGFICAMRHQGGKIYSGGKDGNVVITNCSSLQVEKSISFDGALIRAIDVVNNKALVGLRTGYIYEVDIASGSKKVIMESHSDGEVWGLTPADDQHVVTSGDDNKIKTWNFSQRKCIATGQISSETRKAPRGGASSLTSLPASQCARAVAYNSTNGHIAVGHNDGTMTVRQAMNALDKVVTKNTNSQEWIEAMQYSPDGSKLAVGSHDNNIYIYDSTAYKLLGKLTKHNSFIVSVDWSLDSKYIRSVCGAHELLFFTVDNFQQDTNGASNTKGTQWATGHAKYGWLVDGIFPSGTDGTHINGVDFSKDGSLIATGDDYGLVNIFRNPCRGGHMPISLRGHSEHVVRVAFHNNDTYLFSVGGYDQTLMQFKRS